MGVWSSTNGCCCPAENAHCALSGNSCITSGDSPPPCRIQNFLILKSCWATVLMHNLSRAYRLRSTAPFQSTKIECCNSTRASCWHQGMHKPGTAVPKFNTGIASAQRDHLFNYDLLPVYHFSSGWVSHCSKLELAVVFSRLMTAISNVVHLLMM